MNKTTKIILAILIAIIIWLIGYAIASHQKVNAQQEIIDKQQPIVDAASRIAELDRLIEIAQNNYTEAETLKMECEDTWRKEMDKAHEKADEYRAEQSKLLGLIKSR